MGLQSVSMLYEALMQIFTRLRFGLVLAPKELPNRA